MKNFKGKNNPMYKHGNTNNAKCKNCGKHISYNSWKYGKSFCKSCWQLGKNNPRYSNGKGCEPIKCDCGKYTTRHSKQCIKCSSKISHFLGKKHTTETKLKMSKSICRHHIDMNQKNNNKTNILLLSKSNHQKIHRFMYDYISKIIKNKKILKEYIKWFIKKYGDNNV
jgi:hypothetical protein